MHGDPGARSHDAGDACGRFAFENPHLYRPVFSLGPVEPGRYPALEKAMTRPPETMTTHVEVPVQKGLLVGDPEDGIGCLQQVIADERAGGPSIEEEPA